jgi:hypothetical protein
MYCTLHTLRSIVGVQNSANSRAIELKTAPSRLANCHTVLISGQVANLFSISRAFKRVSVLQHIKISAKFESCGQAMLGPTVPSAIVVSEECPNRQHEELKN